MYRIALTGGIASGKSVVARRLAELGAVHIDADVVAREVVEPGTAALATIAGEFGSSVIAADGSLDRPALGALVFGDAARLAVLNGITHPAVRRRVRELMTEAQERDPGAIVVYDVPLLVEAGPVHGFDLVVVVEADVETRVRRLTELRGMTADAARSRIASQASDAERRAVADVVIDSNGTLDHTLEQVDALWHRVEAAAADSAAG